MGFSELWLFEELLSSGDAEQIDHIFTEHFETRLNEIENSLVKVLPKREAILRAAFRAHRRGEFELSVPVLLAQSDGVCLDMTGFHFFLRDRVTGRPASSAHVDGVVGNEVSSALLVPLATVLPIHANAKERERMLEAQGMTDWRDLNRHIVLHGESVDYGTRINSLKAISLMNYLVGFVGNKS